MTQATVAKTVTIHIGTEKTGTTTLQSLCDTNRDVLMKAGLLYPKSPGQPVHKGLRELALGDFGEDQQDAGQPRSEAALMAALRAEIEASGCDHVLVSHEHFSSRVRDPDCIGRLVTAMRSLADTVRVLVFLRP